MPYCGLHLEDVALTPHKNHILWDTAKACLFHFSTCWNIVFTWDASGRGVCKHDMWQYLRGIFLFCVGIERPLSYLHHSKGNPKAYMPWQ